MNMKRKEFLDKLQSNVDENNKIEISTVNDICNNFIDEIERNIKDAKFHIENFSIENLNSLEETLKILKKLSKDLY